MLAQILSERIDQCLVVHGDRVDSCCPSMPDTALLAGLESLIVHDHQHCIPELGKLPEAEFCVHDHRVFIPERSKLAEEAKFWQNRNDQDLLNRSIRESVTSPKQLPSVDSIFCTVENCREAQVLASAKRAHTHICAIGLEAIGMLGNHLVPMFVECGSMLDAERVFLISVFPNDYAMSSLLQGYIELGKSLHAIDLYFKLQEDIYPAKHTYIVLLKACTTLETEGFCQKIHTDIIKEGFEKDPFVGHTLIDAYGRCGLLLEAREVFDNLLVRDVVSWTALIGVYAKHGLDEEALSCFEQMHLVGCSENVITFVFGLKAAGSLKALDKGREIHSELIKRNLEGNLFTGNTLVDMYVKCGSFTEAWKCLNQLPIRDVFSWTTLIAGCAEHGLNDEALECLEQMQKEGVFPNAATYKSSLKACSKVEALGEGRQLHMELAKQGLDNGLSMANTLIDLYAKCGVFVEAQTMFDKLVVRDVVTWNILIAAYADRGLGIEALSCLKQMPLEGISPVTSTLLCCLKACSSSRDICQGFEVHCLIAKLGYLQDLYVGSALVGMYAKCYSLLEAQFLFDDLNSQDIALWSALIGAYADEGESDTAVFLYERMQEQGLCPNIVTFVSILKSCGSAGVLRKGRQIHAQTCSVDSGELTDVNLDTAVMDMYIKCGSMREALGVFNEAPKLDPVRWSALITGYAQRGECAHVFYLLESMYKQDIQPDDILLLSVLTMCNHVGLADEGLEYLEALSQRYGISLSTNHFNCLVDLLSRVGRVDEAVTMLEKMPILPSSTIWNALLNACKKWGNIDTGMFAFRKMVSGGRERSAAYILMSDICADSHMLQDYEEQENH